MTFPAKHIDLKDIRNKRFDEQGGLCCYCNRPMVREIEYIPGGGQPHNLCTLEHMTDRLDPRRWDKNTQDSPQRYAAACARCNNARSEWNHMHTPKALIEKLSRNPDRRKGREIVLEYYEHREYIEPPPFVPPPPVTDQAGSGRTYPKAIPQPIKPAPLSVPLKTELLRIFCGGQ